MVPDMVQNMVDTTMAGGEGQTLDQIISQNDRELQRRRSTYHPDFQSNGNQETHPRQGPVLEFGSTGHPDRVDYQFNPASSQLSLPSQIPDTGLSQKAPDPRKIRSRESLALDTRFSQLNPTFGSMSTYSPAMITSNPIDRDPNNQFLPSSMDIPLSFDNARGDRASMNLPPQIEQQPMFGTSPTHQPFTPGFPILSQDSPAGRGTCIEQSLMDRVSRMRMPDSIQSISVMNGQGPSSRKLVPTANGSTVPATTPPTHPPQSSFPPNATLVQRTSYGSGSKQRGVDRNEMAADIR